MITHRLRTCSLLYRALGVVGTARVVTARLRGLKTAYVKAKNTAHPILVRMNNSDLPTIADVLCSPECEVTLSWSPRTIPDLSANIGLTAIKLKQEFPQAALIAVEADTDSAQVCGTNLAHLPNTIILQMAIGWEGGVVKCANPTAPSISRQFAVCERHDPGAIQEITIREIIDQCQCRSPILVKMDIEGAEASCFEHTDAWLPLAQGVLVEPHSTTVADRIKRASCKSALA